MFPAVMKWTAPVQPAAFVWMMVSSSSRESVSRSNRATARASSRARCSPPADGEPCRRRSVQLFDLTVNEDGGLFAHDLAGLVGQGGGGFEGERSRRLAHPHSHAMRREMSETRSSSLPAPVVIWLKTISSAALPPSRVERAASG